MFVVYGIWRSSSKRLHSKDIQVGLRFEDWYYGNFYDHTSPIVWTDINTAHAEAYDLGRDHETTTYQAKEFSR